MERSPSELHAAKARIWHPGIGIVELNDAKRRIDAEASANIRANAVVTEYPVRSLLRVAIELSHGSKCDLLETVLELLTCDPDDYANSVDCVQKAAAEYARMNGWDE